MDIQGSWPATAPGREEDISRPGERVGDQAGHLFGGSQGGRLGSAEDDVPDGVVAGYPIPVASTADLIRLTRAGCVKKCPACNVDQLTPLNLGHANC